MLDNPNRYIQNKKMIIFQMSNSGFVSLELPNQNDVNDCQNRYKVPFNILINII